MTTKWKFVDPTGAAPASYTFAVNPNRMTSPFADRELDVQHTAAVDGIPLVSEGVRPPKSWQFAGVILDQAQLDEMNLWMAKSARIYVHDHFSRRFQVVLLGFDVEPGRKSYQYPWHHTYTMRTTVFKREKETVLGNGVWVAISS